MKKVETGTITLAGPLPQITTNGLHERIEQTEMKGQITKYMEDEEDHIIKIEVGYSWNFKHWGVTFRDTTTGAKSYYTDEKYKQLLEKLKITKEGNKLLKQKVYQLAERNKVLRRIEKLIKEV